MASVEIKVMSSIKGSLFVSGGIYRVHDTAATWREILEQIGFHLDPLGKYWISSSSKKIMAVPDGKVENFIREFKLPMDIYVVHVTKANRQTWLKHSEKTAEAIENSRRESQDPGTPGRSSCARTIDHSSGHEPKNYKRTPFGTSIFDEDGPEFPNNPGFEEIVRAPKVDFDDSASMLSQDSQDDGGDLKASIIRKLTDNINNGDLVLAKKEFQDMKERGKTMKVARDIPRGFALLDVFFGQ